MQFGQALVAAYLLCMPLLAVWLSKVGGHDAARMAQVALGTLCALLLLLDRRTHGASRFEPRWLVVAALVVLAVSSVLRAPDLVMAGRELSILLGLIAVALVVSRSADTLTGPGMLVSTASAAYVAVIQLIICITYFAGMQLHRSELFVGYDNYRFFNHVQTAALPLCVLAVTVAPPRSRFRAVAWFALIGGFALLFAIMGRGTLVGIAVGAIAIAAMFGAQAVLTLRNLGLAAGCGLLMYGALFWIFPLLLGVAPGVAEGYYDARVGSIEMRLYLWRIALSYIEQAPWLGIGPMHYAHHPTGDAAHPHNVYLQVAAEWGIPMLIMLLWLYASLIRSLALAVRRCPDENERNCGIGLVFACVAIAVDGLFSGNFVMPVPQVWIAFTVGWALAWLHRHSVKQTHGPTQPAPLRNASRIIAVGLLLSQLWLVASVWKEVGHLDMVVKQAMDRVPSATMNPRFWSHGWF